MPLLENTSCPVCKREFQQGDDVVYCPECGTPHHRECYNMLGHCVNAGLHKSGYSFYDEHAPKNDAPRQVDNAEKAQQNTDNTYSAPFSPFVIPENDKVFETDTDKIDGESVADYASTIRTNVPRFVNLFKEFENKGRKTSWNWSAFIFGPYYLLFRKIYNQGVLFLCIQTLISILGSFALTRFAPKYTEALTNISNSINNAESLSSFDPESLTKISDYGTAVNILIIIAAIFILLRVIIALFADRYYMSSAGAIIKSVNNQLKDGATFTASPLSMSTDMSSLNTEQMKKLYLARRGGTSFFAPLAAYLVMNLLTMLF